MSLHPLMLKDLLQPPHGNVPFFFLLLILSELGMSSLLLVWPRRRAVPMVHFLLQLELSLLCCGGD